MSNDNEIKYMIISYSAIVSIVFTCAIAVIGLFVQKGDKDMFWSEKAKKILSIIAFVFITAACILSIWGAIIYNSNMCIVAIGMSIVGLCIDDWALKDQKAGVMMKVEIIGIDNEPRVIDCTKFQYVQRQDAKTSLSECWIWNSKLEHLLVKNFKFLNEEEVFFDKKSNIFIDKKLKGVSDG